MIRNVFTCYQEIVMHTCELQIASPHGHYEIVIRKVTRNQELLPKLHRCKNHENHT